MPNESTQSVVPPKGIIPTSCLHFLQLFKWKMMCLLRDPFVCACLCVPFHRYFDDGLWVLEAILSFVHTKCCQLLVGSRRTREWFLPWGLFLSPCSLLIKWQFVFFNRFARLTVDSTMYFLIKIFPSENCYWATCATPHRSNFLPTLAPTISVEDAVFTSEPSFVVARLFICLLSSIFQHWSDDID